MDILKSPVNRAVAQAVANSAAQNATIGEAFGIRNGTPTRFWEPGTPQGPELWTLANFSVGGGWNSSTLSPSLTANGTTNNFNRTRLSGLFPSTNRDYAYRLSFDWAITVPSGWAGISVLLTDSGGNTIHPGTAQQYLITNAAAKKSGKIVFEFQPQADFPVFEVRLESQNNAASGTVSISNVSLRSISHVQRPSMISQPQFPSTGTDVALWQWHYDAPSRSYKAVRHELATTSTTGPWAPVGIFGSATDNPFLSATPDPNFIRTGTTVSGTDLLPNTTAQPVKMIRDTNNDQIMGVATPGGPYNGYDLYGNIHGGELARPGATATLKVDRGDGAGFVTYTIAKQLETCRRVQVFLPTQYQRKDNNQAFADVDRLVTIFPDGMHRVDRTTTFTSNQTYNTFFEWMTTHSTSLPVYARLGSGLSVLNETDFFDKLSSPVPSPSTATTGGTLAAATYSYRVTTMSDLGESTGSTAVTQATTGSTSTVTLTWSAVTNAAGYRVYGRTSGVERLLATVGPAATSWTDDGSAIAVPVSPPVTNQARRSGAVSTTPAPEVSGIATWGAIYEPTTGWCYGNIYDADTVLARAEVDNVRSRVYLSKNYMNVWWKNAQPGGADIYAGTKAIPAGTVWSATHWNFVYRPASLADWHYEVAVRAANLYALKALYPTT
ncbi:hypothetical protein [Kineosporia sp. R_H_3]|uniref:hypothetical protein n=1 Tax=Kineosporia sp. R_H_3 TaxID=1961848 RepID=UPI00117BA074|nr:hypothetical protein [Kineosporia sp. R_H_3]